MNSKQFFFSLNTDDTDEFLDTKKGFYREMWNMVPGNEFTSNPSRQNMKGNSMLNIDFDESEGNVCIGACSDNGRNRLIFFIHKPSGTDAIYLWTGGADVQKIFEWTELNFSIDNPIEHAYIIGDLLYWTEKSNPQRCMNIRRALEGDYINKEINIDLFKKAPILPAVVAKTTDNDASIDANIIAFNNYHFSYRYKYKDGVYSTIAPYSKCIRSAQTPSINNIFKSINVTITVPEGLEDYVDKIEILVDENKFGIWKEWESIEDIDTSISQTITRNFTGREQRRTISEEETMALFEPIPRRSDAQVFIKSRSIINLKKSGYTDDGNYSISVGDIINIEDDSAEWTSEWILKNRSFHYKSGGTYSVLLCFYDEYSRLTTTKKTVEVAIPFETYLVSGLASNPYAAKRNLVSFDITGTPPSYAKHFGFAMSREQSYEVYMQIPITALFYVAEYNEGDTVDPGAFLFQGSIYLEEPPASLGGSTATYLHLMMPSNVPFIPDAGYQVRVMDQTGSLDPSLIESIIEVRNNKLVVGDFGIDDWTFLTSNSMSQFMVEVYRDKEIKGEEYFEVGEIHPIEDFAGTKFIEADTNIVTGTTYNFSSIKGSSLELSTPYNNYSDNFNTSYGMNVEAPSNSFSTANIDTTIEADVFQYTERHQELINVAEGKSSLFKAAFQGFAYLFSPPKYLFISYNSLTKNASKTIDYSKPSNNFGRTIISLEEEKELFMPNTIMNSGIYVEDTQINGLHTFNAQTSYVIPYDRGEIVKMLSANEVIVIVHERAITTIYPGEAYVRQGQDDSLALTDNFISQDRVSVTQLGSQDPGTIVEYNGRVYGFDRANSEPWRKSNDGVTPLATTYGVKQWFLDKTQYYGDSSIKIVGGYDPHLSAYFITFPQVGEIQAETIAFFERFNLWIGSFNWDPERYSYLGDDFVSFKSGVPWLHNKNSVRNSFYGSVYPSKIKIVVNDLYHKDKILKAIALETNSNWTVTEIATPAGQSSNIPSAKFKKRGDHYVADVLRDENTPSQLVPSGKPAILFGREMAGQSFEITLENNDTSHVRLRYIDTRFVEVSGNLIV